MNPWVLLGIGVAFVAIAGDDARLRLKIDAMELAEAQAVIAADKRVADARNADAVLTASLAQQAEALKNASLEQINAATVSFSRVASNKDCLRTPAAALFDTTVGVRAGDTAHPVPKGSPAAKPH